jgi:hypothetical protein
MNAEHEEQIELLDRDGTRRRLAIYWRANSPHVEYAMWVNDPVIGQHGVVGSDVFNALCNLRPEIEPKGFLFLCFGAKRNAWPSAMARDMGQGLQAYELQQNEPSSGLRSIFAPAQHTEVTTVGEQKQFCLELLNARFKRQKRD